MAIKLIRVGHYDEIKGVPHTQGSIYTHLRPTRMDGWETIAAYMDGCLENENILVCTMGYTSDVLDPTREDTVFLSTITDGVFVWPLPLNYYVRNYPLHLPEAFRERALHLRKAPVVDVHADYEF